MEVGISKSINVNVNPKHIDLVLQKLENSNNMTMSVGCMAAWQHEKHLMSLLSRFDNHVQLDALLNYCEPASTAF